MNNPYLLAGSFAYDTILKCDGLFTDRISSEFLSSINVCFDIVGSQEHFGGCGGNIAYNASMLREGCGEPGPMLIGVLGADGARYAEHMRAHGMCEATLTRGFAQNTPHCWITTDDGGNQMTSFSLGAATNIPLVPRETPQLWHLAPGNPRTTATLAAQAIREGKNYIFDPGQSLSSFLEGFADDILTLEEIVEHATGIFVNESEAKLLEYKLRKPVSTIPKEGTFLVRTLGSKGVEAFVGRRETYTLDCAPAPQIVDPTGCGDAFRAGFLFTYCSQPQGTSLLNALVSGLVMGAAAISANGGQSHRISRKEFLAARAAYRDKFLPV